MKKVNWRRAAGIFLTTVLTASVLSGCTFNKEAEDTGENTSADNVIITETGEVIEKTEPTPGVSPIPQGTTSSEIITVDPEKLVEPVQEPVQTALPENTAVSAPQYDKMQIVFLGDSIFASNRGDGTSVPERTAAYCEAGFYNLAIGGSRATVDLTDDVGYENWTSTGLVGVVLAMQKSISADIFFDDAVRNILQDPNVDFSKTDYFVVEYGMNDFLSGAPMSGTPNGSGLKSYSGALRYAVVCLKEMAPDATIILCSPTYAQFYDGDWMIGDGNSVNSGYGTLFDYKGTCEYVANEQQVLFYNAYQDLGIDGYTADEYLEDGIHLTDAGRQLYADALTHLITTYEVTKNN